MTNIKLKLKKPENIYSIEEYKKIFLNLLENDALHNKIKKETENIIENNKYEFLTEISVLDIFYFKFYTNDNNIIVTFLDEKINVFKIPENDTIDNLNLGYLDIFNDIIYKFMENEFSKWIYERQQLFNDLKKHKFIIVS